MHLGILLTISPCVQLVINNDTRAATCAPNPFQPARQHIHSRYRRVNNDESPTKLKVPLRPGPRRCAFCNGSNWSSCASPCFWRKCKYCHGTGFVQDMPSPAKLHEIGSNVMFGGNVVDADADGMGIDWWLQSTPSKTRGQVKAQLHVDAFLSSTTPSVTLSIHQFFWVP